ncbi:hypothetical protein FSP39_016995 [Pinctada imbricata]|uniref:Uncharacterized protein n=1 Tax=Pinctada imbricata TaxID=66713 RepID=A0AA88YKR8_PINIB|nr:hypothetical protein FSP39_016995 [Pinctada imbricata]
MTYVFTCLDVHHLITNCRVKVCKDGLPERQIVKDAWLEVARTNSTKLKISHVEDLVDKQSDAIAKTTFSTEVQSVMEQLGYKNEADFCRLVRNFYEAEDDPGINALQRCLRRLEFRDWLLKDVNFGKFPPFGSHILGLPQVMFQGFLTNIERRIQIFPFIKSGCYNVRSLGSLEAENFFGEFQDLDPKGSGVIKAEEIPVALEMACQLNHTRLRDDRPFHMSLSRAKVYPFHELEQECPKDNENMATDSYLYPSHVGNIVPKNHIFDAKLRAKRKAKRKKVEITGPNDAARGVAPVRQHHKCDESKILPHKRLGINIL